MLNVELEWTDNSFIDSNGDLKTDNLRSISNLIFCNGANKIKYKAEMDNMYVNAISFYDENYIYITGVSNINQAEHITTVPNNAFYLRLSIFTKDKNTSYISFLDSIYTKNLTNNIFKIKELEKKKKDSNYTVNNYCLLSNKEHENYYYYNGKLEKDVIQKRNATELFLLDKSKNIYVGNTGTVEAVFFLIKIQITYQIYKLGLEIQ